MSDVSRANRFEYRHYTSPGRLRHLAEIIETLPPGEEVAITRQDKAVATIRLATPTSSEPPRFGTLKGSILFIAPDFDAIPEGFEDYLP